VLDDVSSNMPTILRAWRPRGNGKRRVRARHDVSTVRRDAARNAGNAAERNDPIAARGSSALANALRNNAMAETRALAWGSPCDVARL
jgi:hypothetical protein